MAQKEFGTERDEAPVEAYEKMYENTGGYDLPYTKSLYYPMFCETLKMVKKVTKIGILEVGCGSGSFAQIVSDHTNFNYRGFDFSEAGVKKAKQRNSSNNSFSVANALDKTSYEGRFDTIVCTEVLEHIDHDLHVISNWPSGVNCVCSLPNFDYPTHVRYFRTEEQIIDRYSDLLDIQTITRVARPLFLGRTFREYLRQLRWSRDDPKRFLAMLGYNTFENLAGWFVFSGQKK